MSPAEVVREVRIEAAPEAVFPYLTDPALLVAWMGVKAELSATVGGVFRVEINPERVAVGRYLEVAPPSRVVFTWGWEGRDDVPPGSSTVEVTLTAQGGGTLLRLRHHGLLEVAMPLHAKSWDHNLPRLKAVIEREAGL